MRAHRGSLGLTEGQRAHRDSSELIGAHQVSLWLKIFFRAKKSTANFYCSLRLENGPKELTRDENGSRGSFGLKKAHRAHWGLKRAHRGSFKIVGAYTIAQHSLRAKKITPNFDGSLWLKRAQRGSRGSERSSKIIRAYWGLKKLTETHQDSSGLIQSSRGSLWLKFCSEQI